MRKFLGRRRSDSGPVAIPQSMTALVVDDETSYRTYLTALAEKVGFRCDAAADGAGDEEATGPLWTTIVPCSL